MLPLRPLLGFLVVVATATCVDEARAPTPACQAVLDCYFDGNALQAVPGFDGLFPGDSNIVAETYGVGGTCWIGDDFVAQSCDDRCKGLLWQDCARSYRRVCADDLAKPCLVTTDCVDDNDNPLGECIAETREGAAAQFEQPFCSAATNAAGIDACDEDFALRCRFEDFAILQGQGRQEDEPLFSACPELTRCNAIPPDFIDENTPPDTSQAIGCCENIERDLLVDDRQSCNAPLPAG